MDIEYDLIDFHRAAEQHISTTPLIPSDEVKQLRIKLITEEFNELMKGLEEDDMVEIADACMDLIYVVMGTCVSYGIPFKPCWEEVQYSNMAKFKDGVKKNEYGKVIKPEGWRPPDLKTILERFGW